jgi:hypothetical protein
MIRDLAELQNDVVARGFTRNFGASRQPLSAFVTGNLRIIDTISMDRGTDPGDDVTMYLIEAPDENGYLIVSDSFHTNPTKVAFLSALLNRRGE